MKKYLILTILSVICFSSWVDAESINPEELIYYFKDGSYDEVMDKSNLINLKEISDPYEAYEIAEMQREILNKIKKYKKNKYYILNYKYYKKAYDNGVVISAFRISDYYSEFVGENGVKKMLSTALKKGLKKEDNYYKIKEIKEIKKSKLKGKWEGALDWSKLRIDFDKSKINYVDGKCESVINAESENKNVIVFKEIKTPNANNNCNESGYLIFEVKNEKLIKLTWYPNIDSEEGVSTYITTPEMLLEYKSKIKKMNKNDLIEIYINKYNKAVFFLEDGNDEDFLDLAIKLNSDKKSLNYLGVGSLMFIKQALASMYSNEDKKNIYNYKKSYEIYRELIEKYDDEYSKYQLAVLLIEKKVTSSKYQGEKLLKEIISSGEMEGMSILAKRYLVELEKNKNLKEKQRLRKIEIARIKTQEKYRKERLKKSHASANSTDSGQIVGNFLHWYFFGDKSAINNALTPSGTSYTPSYPSTKSCSDDDVCFQITAQITNDKHFKKYAIVCTRGFNTGKKGHICEDYDGDWSGGLYNGCSLGTYNESSGRRAGNKACR